jgi:histone H3/H4
MLGEYEGRLPRLECDRAARYHERAERFREIAKMEMQPRARARLLELAEEYEQLVDEMAGTRPRRPGGGRG